MKVDNLVPNHFETAKQPDNALQRVSQKTDSTPPAANPETGASSDTSDSVVHLSSTAKDVQLARQAAAREPDIREEKVAELKARIDAGEYQPDAEAVAGKMVDTFLKELF